MKLTWDIKDLLIDLRAAMDGNCPHRILYWVFGAMVARCGTCQAEFRRAADDSKWEIVK